MIAAKKDNVEILYMLIQNKANILTKDKQNKQAFDYAKKEKAQTFIL